MIRSDRVLLAAPSSRPLRVKPVSFVQAPDQSGTLQQNLDRLDLRGHAAAAVDNTSRPEHVERTGEPLVGATESTAVTARWIERRADDNPQRNCEVLIGDAVLIAESQAVFGPDELPHQ